MNNNTKRSSVLSNAGSKRGSIKKDQPIKVTSYRAMTKDGNELHVRRSIKDSNTNASEIGQSNINSTIPEQTSVDCEVIGGFQKKEEANVVSSRNIIDDKDNYVEPLVSKKPAKTKKSIGTGNESTNKKNSTRMSSSRKVDHLTPPKTSDSKRSSLKISEKNSVTPSKKSIATSKKSITPSKKDLPASSKKSVGTKKKKKKTDGSQRKSDMQEEDLTQGDIDANDASPRVMQGDSAQLDDSQIAEAIRQEIIAEEEKQSNQSKSQDQNQLDEIKKDLSLSQDEYPSKPVIEPTNISVNPKIEISKNKAIELQASPNFKSNPAEQPIPRQSNTSQNKYMTDTLNIPIDEDDSKSNTTHQTLISKTSGKSNEVVNLDA